MIFNFLLSSAILMAFLPADAIYDREYWTKTESETYLAKLVVAKSQDPENIFFDFTKLNYDQDIKNWLVEVDSELAELDAFDGDFEFTLNKSGYIESLDILELRETDAQNFKNFVARLLAWQAPELPESLPTNTSFNLNGKWLFLDRANTVAAAELGDFAIKDSEDKLIAQLITELEKQEQLELVLLEPHFIDFPKVGEKIIFQVNKGLSQALVFHGRVVSFEKNELKLLTSKFKLSNGILANKDMLWSSKIKSSSPSSNLMASMTTGAMTWVSTVGLGPAISTNGIATGGAVVLGMLSGWLKEREKVYPLNLSYGESITVKNGGKK